LKRPARGPIYEENGVCAVIPAKAGIQFLPEEKMIEFKVNDMTCGHCAASITKAVKSVDANGTCEVDLTGKRVRIESARPAEAFRAAIEDAGFTPEPPAA
jgi:copper chaperone